MWVDTALDEVEEAVVDAEHAPWYYMVAVVVLAILICSKGGDCGPGIVIVAIIM